MGLKRALGRKKKEEDKSGIWLVSWDARFGKDYYDSKRECKAFTDYDAAVEFSNELKKSQGILRYTEFLDIKIVKQE